MAAEAARERCGVLPGLSRRMRFSSGVGPVSAVSKVAGWSSRKTVWEVAMAVREVRKVLREDAEDPGFEVGAGLEGVEGAE